MLSGLRDFLKRVCGDLLDKDIASLPPEKLQEVITYFIEGQLALKVYLYEESLMRKISEGNFEDIFDEHGIHALYSILQHIVPETEQKHAEEKNDIR